MTPANVRALRLSLGTTAAIAVSYGAAWPMYFLTSLFTAMFLAMPIPWMGWKTASKIIGRLMTGLFFGLIISEFVLPYPLFCIPLYALLFFYIFFNDATAPPLATIFMTMGVTMVPIIGLQGIMASHFIVGYLFLNMTLGFVFTWLSHLIVPDSLAVVDPNAPARKRPPPPPIPSREERGRLALVSTIVATSAVVIFFSFNLAQYALAMIYICMMAGTPNTNASVKVMKANSTACLIGGVAVVVAYNLLVVVPRFEFLILLVLCFSLFFSRKITSGKPTAAAWSSGFTTFLVLLGSSTGSEGSASSDFYLRIAQVLFAGLFCIVGLIVAEHLINRRQYRVARRSQKREKAQP
tara:strand:- start:481 stop:1536 length:1056 start_codon:yes stop_codon:yes gene_type:complete